MMMMKYDYYFSFITILVLLHFNCVSKLFTDAFTTLNISSFSSKYNTILNADLITFDLDDTIFPVGPVVHDANQALIQHLNSNGYSAITQESLITSTKHIRNELLKKENQVVTYTELRKRAICFEMNKHDYEDENETKKWAFTDDSVVHAYDVWEMNRHLAAERHLYHDTIIMLKTLKELFPHAIIGAITNGKGNPLLMKNSIHEYFDFCVSGEDQNVFPYRKPHKKIYLKSLDVYNNLKNGVSSQEQQQINEFCWVHVGDDLANDVGASAKCGAHAVWVDLDSNEYNQTASKRFEEPSKKGNKSSNHNNSSSQPFWSTATYEEIEKRKILNEESMTFVTARINKLSDLPNVISMIIESSSEEENILQYV